MNSRECDRVREGMSASVVMGVCISVRWCECECECGYISVDECVYLI